MKKLIKSVLGCPEDRALFMLWREKRLNNGEDQTMTSCKLYIGRHVLIKWESYYTPVADWK